MKYIYNDHGVCLNQSIAFRTENSLHGNLEIRLAEKDGKWTFGYSYDYKGKKGCGQGGARSGCSFHEWSTFESEEVAMEKAIAQLKKAQYYKSGESCEWHLNELIKFEASRNQLTLF